MLESVGKGTFYIKRDARRKMYLSYRCCLIFQSRLRGKLRFVPFCIEDVLCNNAQRKLFPLVAEVRIGNKISFCYNGIVLVGPISGITIPGK